MRKMQEREREREREEREREERERERERERVLLTLTSYSVTLGPRGHLGVGDVLVEVAVVKLLKRFHHMFLGSSLHLKTIKESEDDRGTEPQLRHDVSTRTQSIEMELDR